MRRSRTARCQANNCINNHTSHSAAAWFRRRESLNLPFDGDLEDIGAVRGRAGRGRVRCRHARDRVGRAQRCPGPQHLPVQGVDAACRRLLGGAGGRRPAAAASGTGQAGRRRRPVRLRGDRRAEHPTGARRRLGRVVVGRRPRHRRHHRRARPARAAPSGQHHQGADRDAVDQRAAAEQDGRGHPGRRERRGHAGRCRRRRPLHRQRPAARPADALRQRRRARAGRAARWHGHHGAEDQRAGPQARRRGHPRGHAVRPGRPRHEHVGLRHRAVLPVCLGEPDFRQHRRHAEV